MNNKKLFIIIWYRTKKQIIVYKKHTIIHIGMLDWTIIHFNEKRIIVFYFKVINNLRYINNPKFYVLKFSIKFNHKLNVILKNKIE